MSSENDTEINWNEVVGKEALGENGLDFGTVKEVAGDYLVTEVGMLNKKIYHLPKSSAKYFNGVFLNFSLNESDLSIYEQKIDESAADDKSLLQSQDTSTNEETLIPLISENLQVTKNIIEDNKKIVKVPIKETKTVQIQLMHEKVTIERRNINQNDNTYEKGTNIDLKNNVESSQEPGDGSEIYSKAEFLIPIKREEPIITKRSFVREEVVIKKNPVTETKTITEEITNEEISYNKGQNIQS
ncbi:YsnF/AvaK domain-containing protein [Candidatus Nitrosocosmicus sp. T]